jgi:hypothetical protein
VLAIPGWHAEGSGNCRAIQSRASKSARITRWASSSSRATSRAVVPPLAPARPPWCGAHLLLRRPSGLRRRSAALSALVLPSAQNQRQSIVCANGTSTTSESLAAYAPVHVRVGKQGGPARTRTKEHSDGQCTWGRPHPGEPAFS